MSSRRGSHDAVLPGRARVLQSDLRFRGPAGADFVRAQWEPHSGEVASNGDELSFHVRCRASLTGEFTRVNRTVHPACDCRRRRTHFQRVNRSRTFGVLRALTPAQGGKTMKLTTTMMIATAAL